jgi:hypothetical protein
VLQANRQFSATSPGCHSLLPARVQQRLLVHFSQFYGTIPVPGVSFLLVLQVALDELLLAEESFSVVTPSLLDSIDNLAMLLLDIVW